MVASTPYTPEPGTGETLEQIRFWVQQELEKLAITFSALTGGEFPIEFGDVTLDRLLLENLSIDIGPWEIFYDQLLGSPVLYIQPTDSGTNGGRSILVSAYNSSGTQHLFDFSQKGFFGAPAVAWNYLADDRDYLSEVILQSGRPTLLISPTGTTGQQAVKIQTKTAADVVDDIDFIDGNVEAINGFQTQAAGAKFFEAIGFSVMAFNNISMFAGNASQSVMYWNGNARLRANSTDLSVLGTTLNINGNPLQSPADPTNGVGVGDRDYNDVRYVQQTNFVQAGNAVAGGRIVSDGSGAQSVASTWGMSACTISGGFFRCTLSAAISPSTDMVVIPGHSIVGGSEISTQASVVSTTQFDIGIITNTFGLTTASGATFQFTVHDAGLS